MGRQKSASHLIGEHREVLVEENRRCCDPKRLDHCVKSIYHQRRVHTPWQRYYRSEFGCISAVTWDGGQKRLAHMSLPPWVIWASSEDMPGSQRLGWSGGQSGSGLKNITLASTKPPNWYRRSEGSHDGAPTVQLGRLGKDARLHST